MVSIVGFSGDIQTGKYCPRYDLNLDVDEDDENTGKEIIHSGHFMVSDIDDSAVQEEDEAPSLVVHESDCDQDTSPSNMELKDFVFDTECKETSKTYTFGPLSTHTISIDASLTKLFECMTLAYSGKLTSPRWKQFKGLKLKLKDKIRLNNIIWRAWHIQFIAKRKPLVCQFASPLDVDVHIKPEALLLEGKYWKRQAASVTAEYKKWRMYYKAQTRAKHSENSLTAEMDWDFRFPSWSNSSLPAGFDDDFFMDFTDTLFSSSHQPFDYQNSREIAKSGNADFIQPGLAQLQPAGLDDFMDTFEPLQDFLWSRLPPLPEEGPLQDFIPTRSQSNPFLADSHQATYSGPNVNLTLPVAPSSNPAQPAATTTTSSQFLVPAPLAPSMRPAPTSPFTQTISALTDTKLFNNASVLPVLFMGPQKSSISSSMGGSLALTSSLIASPSLPVNRPPPGPSLFAFQTKVPEPSTTRNYQMASLVNAQGNMLPRSSTLLNSTLAQVPLMKAQPNVSKPQRKVALKPGPVKTAEPVLVKHSSNVKPYPTFQTQSPGASALSVTKTSKETAVRHHSLAGISKRSSHQLDASGTRRHSYTAGQPSVVDILSQQTYPNISLNIVPNEAKVLQCDTKFAIPKAQPKPRLRSRSMSSPQNSNSQVLLSSKPAQAVSLTNICGTTSHSLLPVSASSLNSLLPATSGQLAPVATVKTVPSSAVLAQLLTSGTSFSHPELSAGRMVPAVVSTANNTTPTVTIISSVPASTTTLVFSPLTLTAAVNTVASEGDLHKTMVVNSLRSIFSSPITQQITFPSKVISSSSATSPPPTSPLLPSSPLSLSTPLASPGPSAEPGATQAKAFRPKSDEERVQYKEHRRVCHINAEQKRRCNIKHGFEALHHLIPSLCANPNSKVSKAAMLQKAVDHIRALKTERQHQLEEMELLKTQIESLNQTINLYQSQLPATGAPVPCQRNNLLSEMYSEHVKARTLQNWKYWVFSLIMEPLLESYSSTVNTSSMEELCTSLLSWLQKHCSLAALRPVVLNSLRQLSTKTNILTQPSSLSEEATNAVTKKEGSS